MSFNHKSIFSTSSFWLFSFFFIILMLDPTQAYAKVADTQIQIVLCNTLELVQGPVGKAIGMIAIIFLGISLFLGKVSWGLAISTAIGIGFIFGAGGIVAAIGGVDKEDCADSTLKN